MQIWFSKFINIGQIHNFSHSFSSMGSNNTYKKLLSNLIHLLWKILRLSLVSQLYLKLCSFYLIFSFVLGLDRLFILILPLWYTNLHIFLHFYLIYHFPPPSPLCFTISAVRSIQMASTNSSFSKEKDNLLFPYLALSFNSL